MSSRSLSNRTFFLLATAVFSVHLIDHPAVLRASSGESSGNGVSETARAENGTAVESNVVTGNIPSPSLSNNAERTGSDYLMLAREASARMFNQVENVICEERIQRYKSRHPGEAHAIDVVEAKVAVADGEERYSDILQNEHRRQTMQQIGGAWSAGEYATFLREARHVLDSNEFITQGYLSKLNGVPAVLFPFDIDERASTWDFLVRAHRYMLAFHGELWVSQQTGEVLRIRRTARHLDVATGIKDVDWIVDFSRLQINGRPLTLPAKALYSVTYFRDDSREWNLTSFYNYKRFGSESTIRFAEVGQESGLH
jgi:hypothetical protein